MSESGSSTRKQFLDIVLYSILFVFFFQLLVDFIEGIYAFGLLGTSIPAELVSVLLLFSPLLMLLLPRGLSGWPLVLVGELVVLSRSVELMLDTRSRMLIAGLGVACFLILFPSMIWYNSRRDRDHRGAILGTSLLVALSLLLLFRVLNSGLDITTDGNLRWFGWFLALIAALLLLRAFPKLHERESISTPESKASFGKVAGLSLGLMAVFIMLYFAFISPNVIARWTGVNYVMVVTVVLVVLGFYAYLLVIRFNELLSLPAWVIYLWNIIFVASLVLTILSYQIRFPTDLNGYPVYAPLVSSATYIPLILMLVLFPIVLLDFVYFYQELTASLPGYQSLGGGFSLAALFLLVMILSHVFTTAYDYIPVIGPFFRDKLWLVYLVVGIVMILPLFLVSDKGRTSKSDLDRPYLLVGVIGLILILTLAAAFLTAPNPAEVARGEHRLKVLTYNIQQGYSESGLKNYAGQLEVIRELDADVIGLQESDTNRIANGNTDIVRYFADNLDMYSYFGPKTITGTFGIALLSKYPIENPQTFYMYSEGEQTAAIVAQITVEGKTFDVFVTHLGNGGPVVQQQAILQEVDGKQDVVLIGDFNFRPQTEQYELTTSLLDDAWLLIWPTGENDQGMDPLDRIDHAFVTPGMNVVDAWYLLSPASDHPAMITEIEW